MYTQCIIINITLYCIIQCTHIFPYIYTRTGCASSVRFRLGNTHVFLHLLFGCFTFGCVLSSLQSLVSVKLYRTHRVHCLISQYDISSSAQKEGERGRERAQERTTKTMTESKKKNLFQNQPPLLPPPPSYILLLCTLHIHIRTYELIHIYARAYKERHILMAWHGICISIYMAIRTHPKRSHCGPNKSFSHRSICVHVCMWPLMRKF